MSPSALRPLLSLTLLAALCACSVGGTADDDGAEQEQALVAAQRAAESVADGGTTVPPPAPVCDGSQVQGLIGQSIDDAIAEQAKTDAGAGSVRVLTPGQMVTMEFDDTRLTIDVDAQGRITALRCG
ncbi:MAG: Elastase inhibitor AFLEI Flags: Precursor [Xanthomonadales bacterium]|nr:Elastase inhibitor AFLEI Flags: Precursor [Xanthomonadaceae bacterium]MBN8225421.1 Elastase inhibitor AFLEI Flags: Precursor [Xanthomonadales bacterium]